MKSIRFEVSKFGRTVTLPDLGIAVTRAPMPADFEAFPTHGATPEQWGKMFVAQDGACAICERKDRRLEVDHDHANGHVRGLLCRGCNHRLRYLEDRPPVVQEPYKSYLMKLPVDLAEEDGDEVPAERKEQSK
jgi:hypothetical protein